jgi:hypothetical protein
VALQGLAHSLGQMDELEVLDIGGSHLDHDAAVHLLPALAELRGLSWLGMRAPKRAYSCSEDTHHAGNALDSEEDWRSDNSMDTQSDSVPLGNAGRLREPGGRLLASWLQLGDTFPDLQHLDVRGHEMGMDVVKELDEAIAQLPHQVNVRAAGNGGVA